MVLAPPKPLPKAEFPDRTLAPAIGLPELLSETVPVRVTTVGVLIELRVVAVVVALLGLGPTELIAVT